jgi:hypothetical protein
MGRNIEIILVQPPSLLDDEDTELQEAAGCAQSWIDPEFTSQGILAPKLVSIHLLPLVWPKI